jgi:Helix-destabilising protein
MSQLLIKIEDTTVEAREVRGKNGTFTAKSQTGIADMPNGERRRVRIRIAGNQPPYGVGLYTISDLSFGVTQWGDFEIAQLHLVPVREASRAAPVAAAGRV